MESSTSKIIVTMHVFSGRPDPTWEIPQSNPSFESIKRKFEEVPTIKMPYRLGYRGFSVTLLGPGTQATETTLHVSSHIELETLLLGTACNVADHVIEHARGVIQQELQAPQVSNMVITEDECAPACKGRQSRKVEGSCSLPKFEPEKWNTRKHLRFNSCYNYANDMVTDTFAQPGRGTQVSYPQTPTPGDIRRAMESDGLKFISCEDVDDLPDYCWNLVALVFWPAKQPGDNWDYHMYRLDDNERFFSHKPGKTPVVNIDNSGKPVTDPRFCNRGPYTEFVGFLETLPDKVSIV